MATWVLPWPNVTTNNLYRRTRYGVRLSDVAKAWREEAITTVRQHPQDVPAGPLALTLTLVPPDRRRRDLDNAAKLVQDSVFAALGQDDSRVAELHVYRAAGAGEPGVRVQLEGVSA